MESSLSRRCLRRATVACHSMPKSRTFHQSRRQLATPAQEGIRAASPIRFTQDHNQFARFRPQAQLIGKNVREGFRGSGKESHSLLDRIRIVPASPSYFTAVPRYTDDLLRLSALLRKYQLLPVLDPGDAPRVAWMTREQYKADVAEPVRAKGFQMMLELLRRLNYIHPSLIPAEVSQALEKFKRAVQPNDNQPKPIVVDTNGIARAVGRRKTSSAAVFLVEGDGRVLVNGRSLTEYFGRLHDRESAMWALKATSRLDKYNVWVTVTGGGTTGQADAIQLGLSKALLAHEPALKPALRRAKVVTRDPRKVERKKHGKLKARKMPAWVKR